MRLRSSPLRSLLWLLAILFLPGVADAACTTPTELSALASSLRSRLSCARLRLENGAALPCGVTPVPACAADGVDQLAAVLIGAGPPASRPGTAVRRQVRCQRAVLGAAARYAARRIPERASGVRRARRASVFASVESACSGFAPAVEQGVALPSLGAPCTAAVTPAVGVIDGRRVARCTRATTERLVAAMTQPVAPNVVLVMTDDQNYASVPWMARVTAWRQRAVDFSRAFVTTPMCAPSRASLLSGQYAQHHGVVSNFQAASNFVADSTLATWLQDAGYVTGLFGKYMNYEQGLTAVPPGWDEWQALIGEDGGGNGYTDYRIDENGVRVQHGGTAREYSTTLLAARALNFMEANAERPFLVVYTPFAPHGPAIPADRHAGALRYIAPWRPPNWHDPVVSTKPSWVSLMRSVTTPEATLATDDFRIAQLETLLSVDEAFGKLEDALEEMGLTDNTVLIFTSDHGYHWGEHWWDSKFTAYDESLRVPLALSYPVLAPEPARRDQIVLNIDLAPTIATLAGGTVPDGIDGRSFVHLLAGPGETRPDFLIRNWGAIIVPPWEGVRGERYKYISSDVTGGVDEELYDLETDPYELTNLAVVPQHAALLDQMRQRLEELRD